jgi:2-polyprenyl-3-methyl-5-hydroxy-6-metoxy-1,4-benzoquinol methylase
VGAGEGSRDGKARMNRLEHWDQVYRTKGPDRVSWFQAEARLSTALIASAVPDRTAAIIDVGGGASTLVDGLLQLGYTNLTVLDIAPSALDLARARLGERGARISWQAGDVLTAPLASQRFDVWHDRAVFHFLTNPADRARYATQVRHAIRPGGVILVATFAEDGPTRCSGLEVQRYSPASLHAEFGDDFSLVRSEREEHITPGGAVQLFTYCVCRYQPTALVPRHG